MCRIGAIKSKVPVEPAKALYLMLPQQEGHDNSGYAMVMQDLYGVFEGHKDKPLLSLACTPRGVRMVDAYMAEQGFEQMLEWLPDVDRRPGLDIKAMPCYVFRNYEYPEAYRGRPQAEREELLLDTRLALRRMLEKDGQGFVYSFWPDVLTLKEIGDPRDIAAYFRLWDEDGPLRAKSIVTQCRQNTNYDIVRYAAHPFFLQGYTLCANGENTFYTKNTEYQKSLAEFSLHPALRAARTEVAPQVLQARHYAAALCGSGTARRPQGAEPHPRIPRPSGNQRPQHDHRRAP